jgi:hypothetical protein
MKNSSIFLVFVIFLFCVWQNSYSQFFYSEYEYKKEEYLPPYVPSAAIVSPEVEKWTKEQLANKELNKSTIKMKTDVLGRVKSKFSSNEIEQEKVVENKQKRLVIVSDMHILEQEIETEHGRYDYNMETKEYEYFLNNKRINKKEYLEYQDKSLEKFKQQKVGKRNLSISGVIGADDRSWLAWMTAEEISELIKNHKEIAIDDYVKPEVEASQASILSSTQLYTHAFPNGYGGAGVGIYVMEPVNAILIEGGVAAINLKKYRHCGGSGLSSNLPRDSAHHTMVANIVQMAAPLSDICGFNTYDCSHPSNPFSAYGVPLEIGTHSYGYGSGAYYDTYDRNMDNYIYENRVINFKSAGNNKNNVVTSPGKAMNIITVGAINPATNNYADYYLNGSPWWSSSWKNPILPNTNTIGSSKPEIAMYTDIEFPNNSVYQRFFSAPGFNGTSAAAPLAAGFTATLLDQHPFFKRQPALTKAVLLTGETMPIPNANSWDLDNSNSGPFSSIVARGIMNYSSVAWGTRSRWWSGGNSAHFNPSSQEIVFIENGIQANKRYRIAIAWLVNGSYVYTAGKLPQDIDLHIEQNDQRIATSKSSGNPFEVVDFITTSNAPLTIIIYRYSNSGSGNVLLGYHMRENF